MIERSELVEFYIVVNDCGVLSEEEKDQLQKAMSMPLNMSGVFSGDKLEIRYKVHIDYFGRIATAFKTILAIMNRRGINVVKVETEEVNHMRCLAQELFCALEEIEQKLQGGGQKDEYLKLEFIETE